MGFNIEQYEMGNVYSNGADWSNATGYTKAELISKIRTAKDSIEKWTNERNEAQVRYNEANGRNCAKDCTRKKNCHSECWSKTRDKDYNQGILTGTTLSISTANASIPVWQEELDALIEKEANAPSSNTGFASGTTRPNATASTVTSANTVTAPKKSNTVLYASIGGAVLILGVVGYFVFKKD